jgi:hypothetical protein
MVLRRRECCSIITETDTLNLHLSKPQSGTMCGSLTFAYLPLLLQYLFVGLITYRDRFSCPRNCPSFVERADQF